MKRCAEAVGQSKSVQGFLERMVTLHGEGGGDKKEAKVSTLFRAKFCFGASPPAPAGGAAAQPAAAAPAVAGSIGSAGSAVVPSAVGLPAELQALRQKVAAASGKPAKQAARQALKAAADRIRQQLVAARQQAKAELEALGKDASSQEQRAAAKAELERRKQAVQAFNQLKPCQCGDAR